MMYTSMPGKAALKNDTKTKTNLNIAGSHFIYLAIPAQTPAIIF